VQDLGCAAAAEHALQFVPRRGCGKASHPHLASAAKHLSALPAADADTLITINLGVK